MLKYVYVDTENIGNMYLEAMQKMDDTYTVFIMFTENSPRVPLEMLESFNTMKCKFHTVKSKCGLDNALDFSIMAYMGLSIAKRPKSLHVVLSNDNGYQAAIALMQDLGYRVYHVHPGNDTVVFRIDTGEYKDEQLIDELTRIFHKGPVNKPDDSEDETFVSDEEKLKIRMQVRAGKSTAVRFGQLVALIKTSMRDKGMDMSTATGKFVTNAIRANINNDTFYWNNFLKSMRAIKNVWTDKRLNEIKAYIEDKIYMTGYWMQ